MIKRIGFACKWSDYNSKGEIVAVPELNFKTTTVAWLKRQSREVAEQRLWDIAAHNVRALELLVEKLSTLEPSLRMARIGSDVFPVYTHDDFIAFWREATLPANSTIQADLARIGATARANNVRLSMHPGQFTVLASDNEGIVQNSIREFEYHTDIARWMGYGQQFQDFKINVHISGRQGPDGIRRAYTRLTPEARNCLTIENEENAWGLDDCLTLTDIVPIVLDVHHHWVKSGEYISPQDSRIQRVVDSWRGVRPTLHYSVSREDILPGHSTTVAPDHTLLLEHGAKKQQLRAHSDFYWNDEVNAWALSHLHWADIMTESKAKNLASFPLYEQAVRLNLLG